MILVLEFLRKRDQARRNQRESTDGSNSGAVANPSPGIPKNTQSPCKNRLSTQKPLQVHRHFFCRLVTLTRILLHSLRTDRVQITRDETFFPTRRARFLV